MRGPVGTGVGSGSGSLRDGLRLARARRARLGLDRRARTVAVGLGGPRRPPAAGCGLGRPRQSARSAVGCRRRRRRSSRRVCACLATGPSRRTPPGSGAGSALGLASPAAPGRRRRCRSVLSLPSSRPCCRCRRPCRRSGRRRGHDRGTGGRAAARPRRPWLLRLDRLVVDDQPATLAVLAGLAERLEQPGADALAGHLHEAERGHLGDLVPGAVPAEALDEPAQHEVAVALEHHVDEVDDDDAADVAQPELADDLLGRLEVVLGDGLLEVAPGAGELAGVDVDDGHRLGAVDDQRPAGGQPDLAVERPWRSARRCGTSAKASPLAVVVPLEALGAGRARRA